MSRFDLARFGAEVFPLAAAGDLMIVAGTVTKKMAPKWCGSSIKCLSPIRDRDGGLRISAGPFSKATTCSKVSTVFCRWSDIPGCPPRPEALIEAFMTLHGKSMRKP